MNAYEFIGKLMLKLKMTDVFKMRYVTDDEYDLWLNTQYCTVQPGKCELGVTIVDDDPDEYYIDDLNKLKDFFIKNNISKNDKMFISTDLGTYPIHDINVGRGADTYVIYCT